MEAKCRTREGSTEQMITLWQQGKNLEAQRTEVSLGREHSIRRLLELTGYEAISDDDEHPAFDGDLDDRAMFSGSDSPSQSAAGELGF